MKKVRRILQTGSIREVREMYVPESFRPRGRRKGPSRRSQEKNNLDAAIREAATILDANFFYARGDRLVTCRYDEAHLPETEEQARENETRLIAACRRWAKKNGESFRFFAVTADKKRNGDPARLHHHLVISAVPAEVLREAWPYRYITGTKQEDGSYTTSREDDIIAFRQAGLDFDTFLKVQNEYTAVNEKYSGAGEKAMAFSHWVNSLDLTAEQAETVRNCFRYYSQIPAEAARYDSFVSAGLDDDAAYALADALNALEPEEGKKTVSNVQRYRAVIEAALSEDEQLAALQELMQESEYSKLQVGYDHGILPEAYVRFRELLPQYDADGNGTLNQKEVEKALDSMGGGVGLVLPGGSGGDQPLTVKQQAVLWQLANKSWKPNKNPYSTSVGKKVYDALNAEPVSGGILLPDRTGGLELPRG